MSSQEASMQDWQMSCKDLKQRTAHILHTGLWSDCTFLVGPKRVPIDAHKLILAIASPVFEAMFYGSIAEEKLISIPDVNPEIFQYLLNYIYTDEVNLKSCDDAFELFQIAHKYMLPQVVETCAAYLSLNITPKDACSVYELAVLYNETELMVDALMTMCLKTKEVLTNDSFVEAKLSTIVDLFSSSKLNIDSEIDLLDAAEKYAQHCKNTALVEKTTELSICKAVKHIRFLTLTPQLFAERKTTLLTESESYALIMNISSMNTEIPMPKGFTTSKENRDNDLTKPSLVVNSTIKIAVLDSTESEPIYLKNLPFTILVKKFKKSLIVGLNNPSISVLNSWSSNCIVKTTALGYDSANVINMSSPLQFHSGCSWMPLCTITISRSIVKDYTVTLELCVMCFATMNDAWVAARTFARAIP